MSEEDAPAELVTVRLIGMPLAIQARSAEHQDGLRREFRMLVEQGQADRASVPGRLIALAAELDRRFQSFGAAGRAEIEAAAGRGDASIDLTLEAPRAIGAAARDFGRMLEEADEYCRAGEHLLTLASPADVVDFRNWVLAELEHQAEGGRPVPWPEYKAGVGTGETHAG